MVQYDDEGQDRYRELLRVSRQWRDLHNRIRGGAVHDRLDKPADGALALFCPTCPQMGINIPPSTEWKEEDRYANVFHIIESNVPRHRLLYRPQIVVDGNMKLIHLILRRPEDDVSLSDGAQFLVRRVPYMEHLATAPNSQPVSVLTRNNQTKANLIKEI